MENSKVYGMNFTKIYQLLLNKAMKKGRTKEEADEVIRCSITGNKARLSGGRKKFNENVIEI